MPEGPRRADGATRTWIRSELASARASTDPWLALERAHIVSQPYAMLHTRVHLAMLRRAIANRNRQESLGQVLRFVVAGPGSLTGRYPRGNTGTTAMGLLETADVPPDLAQLALAPSGTTERH